MALFQPGAARFVAQVLQYQDDFFNTSPWQSINLERILRHQLNGPPRGDSSGDRLVDAAHQTDTLPVDNTTWPSDIANTGSRGPRAAARILRRGTGGASTSAVRLGR